MEMEVRMKVMKVLMVSHDSWANEHSGHLDFTWLVSSYISYDGAVHVCG